MPTLAEMVITRLRQDIAAGQFKPGQRLDETSLAQRYGVSRTPVREALLQLAGLGLVMKETHKGCKVVIPT